MTSAHGFQNLRLLLLRQISAQIFKIVPRTSIRRYPIACSPLRLPR